MLACFTLTSRPGNNSLRAEQGIPEIITLGGNSSHSSSVPSTSGTPHSWGVPWELCTPRLFPYSKPGCTNKGCNIIVP